MSPDASGKFKGFVGTGWLPADMEKRQATKQKFDESQGWLLDVGHARNTEGDQSRGTDTSREKRLQRVREATSRVKTTASVDIEDWRVK